MLTENYEMQWAIFAARYVLMRTKKILNRKMPPLNKVKITKLAQIW